MKNRAKITIEVPTDLKAALEKQAKGMDSDLSKVCRQILRKHIAAVVTPAGLGHSAHQPEPAAA